jgi:CRP/FNR family transcriptional regulator, cyclic AMP receptor protein
MIDLSSTFMKSSNGNGHSNDIWSRLTLDPALGAKRLELADGQTVYDAGAPAEQLYFVEAGQVRTYEAGSDESARLLEILGPGDWFGEDALSSAEAYSSRAVVVSNAVLWTMPVERVMESFCREPKLAAELIRQLASRLQAARQDASQFVFDDCSARLVKTLLRFSATAAATPLENGTITLRITHRQLAQAVGAARETVSLALTNLRQQNLLRTGRNRLVFNPDSLQALIRNSDGNAEVV